MDILQPVPLNEWNLLRDSLTRDWPTYSYYYYLIHNAIEWKKKDAEFKLQIFCPNGELILQQTCYIVSVFTFKESKDMLLKVLKETKLVNWNELILFPAVHPHFSDVLENFINTEANNKNITVKDKHMSGNYFKPKKECLKIEVSVPEECELGHLDESHIPFIHSVWPHRSENEPEKSCEFIASIVKLNRGIGLFLKEDGNLVSWILHFAWGGLGALQTIEEYKRRGYGKIAVKAITKEIAEEENLDSFAFVVNENVPSERLFESLGYKRLQNVTFYTIAPKNNSG
ncbi:glycine N-acyltransferase-like protein 3 isoform X2 [Phymastichus coffea]|uniref:glycine N-acyltransferase-like protein 3 isoform X2 n=1 Tax=Phymastichus coffea TaxID=108790 RepID=UPI00273B8A5F|nr:glycine N-acyltransferase-like protein 3 isoform X2 [Phymastichus coffea]